MCVAQKRRRAVAVYPPHMDSDDTAKRKDAGLVTYCTVEIFILQIFSHDNHGVLICELYR